MYREIYLSKNNMFKLSLKIKCLPNNNCLIKYTHIISIILGTTILLIVMLFLYKNVYKTLVQTELINNLKSKVVQENLNLNKFNQIIENIKHKSDCLEVNTIELIDPTIFVE